MQHQAQEMMIPHYLLVPTGRFKVELPKSLCNNYIRLFLSIYMLAILFKD